MRKLSASRFLLPVLAASAFVAVSPSANATSTLNVVLDVTIEGNNFARLALGGSDITGRPACHTPGSFRKHYAWDISTHKGKAMLSAAQAALLSGKPVSASGSGNSCTAMPGGSIETLHTLTLWAS